MQRDWNISVQIKDAAGTVLHEEMIKSKAARFSVFAAASQKQIKGLWREGATRADMLYADGTVHASFDFDAKHFPQHVFRK